MKIECSLKPPIIFKYVFLMDVLNDPNSLIKVGVCPVCLF